MKIVFFKRPKPKHFDYKPIYWDEEKEEAAKRKRRIELAGKEKTIEEIKAELKFQIDNQWRMQRQAARQKNYTIRLLIYLSVICFFVYMIFFTDLINNFLSFFVK